MKINIKKEVFQKFHPNFQIAFLLVENPTNQKLEESQHLLKEIETITQFLFQKDSPKTHHLISSWATLQQQFQHPPHHQTALEKLLKKTIKKKKLQTKNTLLNLTTYLSLKHLIPTSTDDFQKITSPFTFQLSHKKEKLSPLKKLKENTLYCRDKNNLLATKLDYWKSKKTQPQKTTTQYLVHFEALPPITKKKLQQLLKEAQELIQTFCQTKPKAFILNKNKPSHQF